MDDDLELLERWAQGDTGAGSALFERHFDAVYRFLSSRVASDADVTDLAQKTFLASLESRERLGAVRRFKPYLLGIAHKQLLMFHRYNKVRAGERPAGSAQQQMVVSAPRLSAVAAQRERHRALLVALRKLPEDLQLTLELHYWEGLTTAEIGEIVGLTAGAVKTRLFTARKKLAELVEHSDAALEKIDVSCRDLGAWIIRMQERRRDLPT